MPRQRAAKVRSRLSTCCAQVVRLPHRQLRPAQAGARQRGAVGALGSEEVDAQKRCSAQWKLGRSTEWHTAEFVSCCLTECLRSFQWCLVRVFHRVLDGVCAEGCPRELWTVDPSPSARRRVGPLTGGRPEERQGRALGRELRVSVHTGASLRVTRPRTLGSDLERPEPRRARAV